MKKGNSIEVKGVNKEFIIPHNNSSTLKSKIINPFKKSYNETQHALKDVTFSVKKGEFFGVVGRNGSGKSTLLKCIAGVYSSSEGTIELDGKLVPFIELGVGFNPELSGRDNVYLNGAMLGFTRPEINDIYQEIVDFSELERFMDQKLKNYSSGMQVRLAFSIAIQAKGDILVLDEVLAVGDTAFQKKCNDYFYQLKAQGQTVVLVTHNMGAVEQYCDRALIIDDGIVLEIAKPSKIADIYNELNLRTSTGSLENTNETSLKASIASNLNLKAFISKVETYNPKTGKTQNTFTYKEDIGVRYYADIGASTEDLNVGLVFRDGRNNLIFATNTKSQNKTIKATKTSRKIIVEFEINNTLTNSTYTISGALANYNGTESYYRSENFHQFEVGGWKMGNSLTNPNHKISIIK
jgi:ABC-2 type transport system ATP-binding protein